MRNIIEKFQPQGGAHCISNALKQVFTYYGYPLSEAMIFGLASGLSFLYINQAHSPMVNGRTKVFDFEHTLARRLHISIQCKSGKEYVSTLAKTKYMIDHNDPVLIYVDMPYLPYLSLHANSHFGGHAVVVFGYDDERQLFWVSDRDQSDVPIKIPTGISNKDYHLVTYQDIEQARTSNHRPFPANQKYLRFDFTGYEAVNQEMICSAIQEMVEQMLNPPAKLLGIEGIQKFSKEILTWKKFSIEKLKTAGITNYYQIHQDGGTGGGIFRHMYGAFLIESATYFEDDCLSDIGLQFIEVARLWDTLAQNLMELAKQGEPSLLESMSHRIIEIYEVEKKLYLTLAKAIASYEKKA